VRQCTVSINVLVYSVNTCTSVPDDRRDAGVFLRSCTVSKKVLVYCVKNVLVYLITGEMLGSLCAAPAAAILLMSWFLKRPLYVHIYVCMYVYIYIYIYTYRYT